MLTLNFFLSSIFIPQEGERRQTTCKSLLQYPHLNIIDVIVGKGPLLENVLCRKIRGKGNADLSLYAWNVMNTSLSSDRSI